MLFQEKSLSLYSSEVLSWISDAFGKVFSYFVASMKTIRTVFLLRDYYGIISKFRNNLFENCMLMKCRKGEFCECPLNFFVLVDFL